jgi:hypothetical protein
MGNRFICSPMILRQSPTVDKPKASIIEAPQSRNQRQEKTQLSERKAATLLQKKAVRPGPKPDTLKLRGNWRDAVKRSLRKKKPPEGWPK